MSTVKKLSRARRRRPYDASLRRGRAQETRERILAAAERRFLRDGYAPTTVAAIADDVGVSVDTIFKSFGGKPGIIRAIRERTLLSEAPVPAERRSDDLQAREPDPRRIIQAWGTFTAELMPH